MSACHQALHYPQTKSNGSASGHRSRLAAGQDRCFLRITFQTHSQPRLDRGGGHAPLPCRPLPQFQFQPKYLFVHAHVGGPALFYIKMKANRKPTNVINSSTACLGVWSPQAQAGAERPISPSCAPRREIAFPPLESAESPLAPRRENSVAGPGLRVLQLTKRPVHRCVGTRANVSQTLNCAGPGGPGGAVGATRLQIALRSVLSKNVSELYT